MILLFGAILSILFPVVGAMPIILRRSPVLLQGDGMTRGKCRVLCQRFGIFFSRTRNVPFHFLAVQR